MEAIDILLAMKGASAAIETGLSVLHRMQSGGEAATPEETAIIQGNYAAARKDWKDQAPKPE